MDVQLSTLTLTFSHPDGPLLPAQQQRSDGQQGGLLRAEVPLIGDLMGGYPSSIQSLTTFSQGERSNSAQSYLSSLTGM